MDVRTSGTSDRSRTCHVHNENFQPFFESGTLNRSRPGCSTGKIFTSEPEHLRTVCSSKNFMKIIKLHVYFWQKFEIINFPSIGSTLDTLSISVMEPVLDLKFYKISIWDDLKISPFQWVNQWWLKMICLIWIMMEWLEN